VKPAALGPKGNVEERQLEGLALETLRGVCVDLMMVDGHENDNVHSGLLRLYREIGSEHVEERRRTS
jgi:hypothetical protein